MATAEQMQPETEQKIVLKASSASSEVQTIPTAVGLLKASIRSTWSAVECIKTSRWIVIRLETHRTVTSQRANSGNCTMVAGTDVIGEDFIGNRHLPRTAHGRSFSGDFEHGQ